MGCVTSLFKTMKIGTNKRRKSDDDPSYAVPKRAKVAELSPGTVNHFAIPSGSSNCITSTKANVRVASTSKPKVAKVPTTNSSEESDFDEILIWDEVRVLSVAGSVPLTLATSFVKLLSEGCTLPFIARYRKANVGNLLPAQ